MAFYADYWAVIGTAGPVLAIGIVFAMPQAVEAARKLRPESIEQPESLLGRAKLNMTLRYWNVADLQYWSTAAGFTIDAVLLFSALLSLEWRRNALPPGLVTGLAVAALVLLLLQMSFGRLATAALTRLDRPEAGERPTGSGTRERTPGAG
jgi:hypothetical protein